MEEGAMGQGPNGLHLFLETRPSSRYIRTVMTSAHWPLPTLRTLSFGPEYPGIPASPPRQHMGSHLQHPLP